ncbi:hypothetical protein [Kutzneria albida]|uniref:Uncharacterized protein n=1 Tax=Kutzneria albida DSM 43870 TaxID=1449976 RepID=W5WG29_9PSEU|nr:hypothetical protein [Kutzneria albida]AHI00134.1 hypothetical protein KALB_6775 [Kutzneria albida DSM 43870]
MSTDSLTAHLYRLTDALLVWEGRDDTKAQPGVRQAANIAVDSIDALLHELHELRGSLLAEIRASDLSHSRLHTSDRPSATSPRPQLRRSATPRTPNTPIAAEALFTASQRRHPKVHRHRHRKR